MSHMHNLCSSVLLITLLLINMEFESFIKIGQEIGLEGMELVQFAREREQLQEKKQREHYEREERRIEREEKQQVREHEREMKAYELRIVQEHAPVSSDPGASSTFRYPRSSAKTPKLPCFNDQTDDMDAYLRRFEQFAELNSWPEEEWGLSLSALLKGKALEVFSRLPVEKAKDFSEIKTALLNRFRLTEEGFRLKFRTSKRETGERYAQFADRLKGYVERWVELGKIEKSYDKVVDLFVSEQILEVADKDLALHVKERKPKDLAELTDIADHYMEAHDWLKKKPDVVRPKTHPPRYQSQTTGKSNSHKSSPSPNENSHANRRCYKCGKTGHIAQYCRTNPANAQPSSKSNKVAGLKVETESKEPSQTGAACLNMTVTPTEEVEKTDVPQASDKAFPFISAACTIEPSMPVRKGVVGARDPQSPDESWQPPSSQRVKVETATTVTDEKPGGAVETRGMKVRKERAFQPLVVMETDGETVSKEEILLAQQQDPTLAKLWKHVDNQDPPRVSGKANVSKYVKHRGLLYREFQSPKVDRGRIIKQLVVPQKYRGKVLKLAHDSPLAGHLGIKKKTDKLCLSFYWPGVSGDVQRYCRSCDICQRTVSKGRVGKVSLGEMPLIDTPFKRIAVDLVGPIHPITDRGNRYILVVVDYATRYPEAVALPRIESERVAEALLEVYSRLGIPQEVLTDMGTQFTSEVMREVGRLLTIKQLTTTPYHPICNGLVERFNATLKKMLRRMCAERPKDWDRFLPALLFAYREAPQESLGFSPFELMYGRSVKGPLSILQDIWSEDTVDEDIKTTYQYVVDMRERLQSTCELARDELAKASKRYRRYYNAKARDRRFRAGDRVLILRPTDHNKLLMQWTGPYPVVRQVAKHDYVIQVRDKERTYHANLLKLYVERGRSDEVTQVEVLAMAGVGFVVEDPDEEDGLDEVVLPPVEAKEDMSDVHLGENLDDAQRADVDEILQRYTPVLTDLPGKTHIIEHTVHLTTDVPIRSKPYPTPQATREVIKKEIDSMLKLGVIEHSESPYASPIVLVRKPDGSNRFCIDYRKINNITVFDPEPIPNADDLMARLGTGKFFSKLDLSKGYWQVPIADEDKKKTAFVTAEGLYQFRVLPFGMVNAPALFSRMMRKLLQGQEHVINYIDDVLIYTDTWVRHLQVLKEVLQRLQTAGLTARPSKCYIGCKSLEFLGHIVGNGVLRPRPGKVEQIVHAARPVSKKEVRSFIGLLSYYRKFVPNFAAIAAPLTDLTRKGAPNSVQWGASQEQSFRTLKSRLESEPILSLPDPDKPYILAADASEVGIGAVLMQERDGTKHPVSYASRKLLPRERAYSTIERECLALVWAISKFHIYLYGREFVLETDHHPLSYLTKAKVNNNRVMRWALSLQPYRFIIRAIKGSQNVGPDFLSRCTM
ncbi:uncharacterized protein LOC119723850 isoform X2 [Patiria miniata]|uniref:Reverse transcriptase n=1 Tax=Patiria miniata TaxID=46514 RepID=A0A913ZFT7_PATMI|nr:uncharacterized protein LOC119723850 isoform X2 [Patiria miniata]